MLARRAGGGRADDAPRCKISMEGLKNLHTGDSAGSLARRTSTATCAWTATTPSSSTLSRGPGAAPSRAARKSWTTPTAHVRVLEFITRAGRPLEHERARQRQALRGGRISFTVAFGTLTAEEAVVPHPSLAPRARPGPSPAAIATTTTTIASDRANDRRAPTACTSAARRASSSSPAPGSGRTAV